MLSNKKKLSIHRESLKIPKKTFVLVFAMMLMMTSLQSIASVTLVQGGKITVKEKSIDLDDLIWKLEKQTGYDFVFNSELLGKYKNLNVQEVGTIDEVLKAILKGKALTYEVENDIYIIRKKEKQPVVKKNQQVQKKEIWGKVTDKEGNTLPGVSVVIKGTTTGVATDIDGNYILEIPDSSCVLLFSFVGMIPKEINYDGKSTINVVLISDSEQMEEIIVVGYGSTAKKDLTGSISSIRSKDITDIKTQSIENTLTGKLSGVLVTPGTGQPGKGGTVHIRGLSQINGDNQPLYVIDGVPFIISPQGLDGGNFRENPLLSIDPSNVERVDVLKDASAAAIYGSRAANGVILITTKKGKKGELPRLSFSVSSTIQNPVKKHKYLNSSEWKKFMTRSAQYTLDNSSYSDFYWPYLYKNELSIIDGSFFGNEDTDWQDRIINKNTLWTKYSVSLAGGTEKTNYIISGSVSNQEGALIKNKFNRYNFSSSISSQVVDYFKVGGSINYNYTVDKSSDINSLKLGNFRPDIAPRDEKGNYTTYASSIGNQYNILGKEGRNKNKSIGKSVFSSVYGELNIVDGLKLKTQLNVSLHDDKTTKFVPSYNNLYNEVYKQLYGATLGVHSNSSWSSSFVNTLSYIKTFSDIHRVNAVLGVAWDHSRQDYESLSYRGFPDNDNLINTGSSSHVEFPKDSHIENGLNSMFARINYTYNDKYLATFTARRDESTKFGPGNKAGFFPSGALAWNMHNEDFLKDNKIINKLKLRASLGKTGSDNLPSFSYLNYHNPSNFYNNKNGIITTGVPNKNIKWETTNQLDLGVDFGLLNNKINGEIVYFEKNTSDIILYVPVPGETGDAYWNNNIADITNKGWEFSIGGDVIRKTDFAWNTTFNVSFIKNEVTSLNKGTQGRYGSAGIIEGEPIGVIEGYDVVKIAQSQEEIAKLNADSPDGTYFSSLLAPGDYIFRDVNGDKKINERDKIALGDGTPDFFGGWSHRFTYKNWQLGMNFTFVSGVDKEYLSPNLDWSSINYNANLERDVLRKTWSPENPDAHYARFGSQSMSLDSGNSRSVHDASFIKFRSASISYSLPTSLLKTIGIKQAKLSLAGNNLFTITNYPGLDPTSLNTQDFSNTSSQTTDRGFSYPNTQSFTFSINVTL